MSETTPLKKSGRKEYITLMNVVSAVAVVFLHTNNAFWAFTENWPFSNVVENIFYFAVPIFFMISGATLMDYNKRYTTKEFFKKRFTKTVIPYVFWDLFALGFLMVLYKTYTISDINPRLIFNGLFGTTFVNVYWFFIPLFCIYLCIPVLAAIPKEKRKSVFSFAAIVTFVINILVPFLIMAFDLNAEWLPSVKVGAGYLFFVFVGYLLSEYDLKPIGRVIIYVLGVGGFLLQLLGTYYLSMEKGSVVRDYKGYTNLPCVLYSIAIFVLLKQIGKFVMKGGFKKVIDFLAGYTFPIYLMHIYFKMYCFDFTNLKVDSPAFILCAPLVIIPCCILITMILRKIPLIKHIVP